MNLLNVNDVIVPASVPEESREEYVSNFLSLTRSTGRLMLFAGDQKTEHLNSDFYGEGISPDDSDPEHLFRIAANGTVGCFAAHFGLIARYGPSYPGVGYLVKLNTKTNLVPTKQAEPYSGQINTIDDVMLLRENGLRVLAVGYTIYLGSEHESSMLTEAAQIIAEAHREGLVVVLWIYPRGKAVTHEKDPDLIAGACGVGACLGADFVKVSYPQETGFDSRELLKQAVRAAGRTGVVCAGGGSDDVREFLQRTYDQIHISGARGNATGRNIHQKDFDSAVRMCDAIASIVYGERDVDFAQAVYDGNESFKL